MKKAIWIIWIVGAATLFGYGIHFTYLYYKLDVSLHEWRWIAFQWKYLPMWVAFAAYLFTYIYLRLKED